MAQRTAVVASRVGLHARPAMIFTNAVAATGVPVTLARPGGEPVDASSILFVMSLGVPHGEEVTLTTEDGAERVLDELVTLLETDLDAQDAPTGASGGSAS
ncbi:HPr family phosphocarrier protein [Cellulomonas fimi]|uniref:Phosphocarrier protein HPr n=1 Tax=Cellulomonas fimi (strain ATCC 484 / DSM 20113 / JCM 1341 / CCUG 24087 / LMG 16345 / NBRC 15513 / NCIMB 8980 / NCTC 7547 / NRS-133) TaxID=590998 RepID=F4H2J0_CELFA|nr:HPr family phosphocarrier protein [Cellulomonas fimi]AEE45216.1 Phosphotransferase system, phosphocarrier protein HPr [Cellulomonas fimi ATCC 484]NNH07118.1 HPr family phosphocarrier protein [Cellulomonas fimi]VEH28603.1 Phosphocarrier protein HPr [Cellulomonas fimi]